MDGLRGKFKAVTAMMGLQVGRLVHKTGRACKGCAGEGMQAVGVQTGRHRPAGGLTYPALPQHPAGRIPPGRAAGSGGRWQFCRD